MSLSKHERMYPTNTAQRRHTYLLLTCALKSVSSSPALTSVQMLNIHATKHLVSWITSTPNPNCALGDLRRLLGGGGQSLNQLYSGSLIHT